MAGSGILLTYTGHAHSSSRVRDYSFKDLEFERVRGWPRRRRVMKTVEEAAVEAGFRPLVLAMGRESGYLRTAQRLFFADIAGKGRKRKDVVKDLEKLAAKWRAKFAAYPLSRVRGHGLLWGPPA